MALMEIELFSQALGMRTQVNVILPQKDPSHPTTAPYPVLWLLHGASDDHTAWLRRSSIERYVAPHNLAVVMPSVHLSRYSNMAHGPRYFDYVAHELPEALGNMLPLSPHREDNSVAGLSMGGYGALKLGLTLPHRYAAIGCLSSGNLYRINTPTMTAPRASGLPPIQEAVYGTSGVLAGDPTFDLYPMAEAALASGNPLPRIFHACGREDFLLESAREASRWFGEHEGFEYVYHEDKGSHTWAFWDEWIQVFLDWLVEGTCLRRPSF